MTVAWISDTDYHKIFRTLSLNFSKNYCSFEKLYPKLHSVFHPISRHLEVGLQKLGCASIFNTILGVWISDETLRVVLDILPPYFLVFHRFRSFLFFLCSWYHCRWSCVRSPPLMQAFLQLVVNLTTKSKSVYAPFALHLLACDEATPFTAIAANRHELRILVLISLNSNAFKWLPLLIWSQMVKKNSQFLSSVKEHSPSKNLFAGEFVKLCKNAAFHDNVKDF